MVAQSVRYSKSEIKMVREIAKTQKTLLDGKPIFCLFFYNFYDSTRYLNLLEFVSSEDYYGDLDLKSIRKSELHLGLGNSKHSKHDSGNNSNTPPPSRSTSSKPRPSSSGVAQTRAQPNTLPAQRSTQGTQKDYDEESA